MCARQRLRGDVINTQGVSRCLRCLGVSVAAFRVSVTTFRVSVAFLGMSEAAFCDEYNSFRYKFHLAV